MWLETSAEGSWVCSSTFLGCLQKLPTPSAVRAELYNKLQIKSQGEPPTTSTQKTNQSNSDSRRKLKLKQKPSPFWY